MKPLRLAILKNESLKEHLLWVNACAERRDSVEWEVIEMANEDWFGRVKSGSFDGLLAQPGGLQSSFKNMYDERVRILNEELGLPVFPQMKALMIYENKRYLSYWLTANSIPHPSTHVFYLYKEAMNFADTCTLPLVGKLNIGAGGRGVAFFNTRDDLKKYISEAFQGKGLAAKAGPKWRRKGFLLHALKKLTNLAELREKRRIYSSARTELQKSYVIFQEYIPHTYEWRCVRIGDSFFGHKKVVVNGMASGSLAKQYDAPPASLLDFVKKITDDHHLFSQAIDIFEYPEGTYLVNEMQCIFGQSDPYQMLIDGRPGRYRFVDGEWIFEEGDFNRHESFLLRLDYFIASLQQASRIKMPVP